MTTLNQMGRTMARNTSVLINGTAATITEVSRLTGVSRSTLGRIEAAKRARKTYNPMLKTVVKLANAGGVSIEEYLQTLVTWN